MPSTGCIKLVSLYKSKYCWTLSKVRYMESSINLPIRVDIVIYAHQETISNSATYKYHNLLILLHIISLPQIPWRYSVSGSIQCCSFLWFQTKRHNVSSLQWNNAMLSTRDVQLGNFLSISISTNSMGLLSISTFINSTQAENYQYQLNLSCSNQLINSISTCIP